MPIYEYRCEDCGHTLDALQKVSDPHLTECPKCEHPALKRLISAPAFRLKGSGWYETDFKSDKERKRNLVDGKQESGADGKADSGDSAKEKKSAADTGKPSGEGSKSTKSESEKKEKKSSSSGSEAA